MSSRRLSQSQSQKENANEVIDDDDEAQRLAIVGDYRPGSIRRIKLKNFLTHANVEFEPGPRLNMVVGANGTGKSTILNAIALGLGGEPAVLGRADDLRAFIMHGKDKCEIEIELTPKENAETHIFTRTIDRNRGAEGGRGRGASFVFINGNRTNTKAVRELVAQEYHTQIDNLCTFLPQDKVGNFSGFTDQERLLETEKTLPGDGDQWFYHTHKALMEKESNLADNSQQVASLRASLAKKEHDRDRLHVAHERQQEHAQAEAHLDLLLKKKLWLEFEDTRKQALELKEARAIMKKELKAAATAMLPLQERALELRTQEKQWREQTAQLDGQLKKTDRELAKQAKKFELHDDELENVAAALSELESRRASCLAMLEKALEKQRSLEEQLASFGPPEEFESKLREAKEQSRSLRHDLDAAKKEHRSVHHSFRELEDKFSALKGKETKMNDDGARRKEMVLRNNKKLEKTCSWLDQNRGLFRKPVFGPIAVEMTTKSLNTAAYLEYHVPNNILTSFVVQTNEDRELLYREMREKQGVAINVISVAGSQLDTSRMYSDQKMDTLKRDHGVNCYLDETFQAPDPVMIVLQKFASVNKVLVGGEKTQDSIDHKNLRGFLSQPEGGQRGLQRSCVFAAKGHVSYRYTQTVSTYSGKCGSKMDQVSPARMLAPGVDPEKKAALQRDLATLNEEMTELRPVVLQAEEKYKEIEGLTQQAQLNFQSCRKQKESFDQFRSKIKRQVEKVQAAEEEVATDETAEKQNLFTKLAKRFEGSMAAIQSHSEQQSLKIKYTTASAGISVQREALLGECREAERAVEEKKRESDSLEQKAREAQRLFTKKKEELQKMREFATREAPLVDASGNDLPLKEQLESLEVNEVVEVDAAIEEAERVLQQYDANPEVVVQYERVKEEVELLQQQLEEITTGRDKSLQVLETLRHEWESRLTAHIDHVNKKFSVYMDEMGCTGEVKLTTGTSADSTENTGNFKQWGVQILVSFRENSKAQVLSAQRHSGGERSVSTILYLMALQEMMVAPFRCVDEINQGLDDRNERLVFKRIVQNSSRRPVNSPTDHSGQYFLITPKLLPNLTDMEEEAMTMLFVFNGPFNFDKAWNVEELLAFTAGSKRSSISNEAANDDENSGNTQHLPRRSSKKNRLSVD